MYYFVSFNTSSSQEYKIEISRSSEGQWVASQEGSSAQIDIVTISSHVYSLLIDGHVYDIVLHEHVPEQKLYVNGQSFMIRVESERARLSRQSQKDASRTSHDQSIKAPMPGRIVKLCVNVGDEVQPGQALIVIEAMKMENELRAKSSSKIDKICVEVGATVDMGTTLLTLV